MDLEAGTGDVAVNGAVVCRAWSDLARCTIWPAVIMFVSGDRMRVDSVVSEGAAWAVPAWWAMLTSRRGSGAAHRVAPALCLQGRARHCRTVSCTHALAPWLCSVAPLWCSCAP